MIPTIQTCPHCGAPLAYPDGKQEGPFPLVTLQEKISSGDVSAGTPIWRDGLGQWTVAGELPELRSLFPPPFASASPS